MSDPSIVRFRALVEAGLAALEARREEVNDLNVFPVADGDTVMLGPHRVPPARQLVAPFEQRPLSPSDRGHERFGGEQDVQRAAAQYVKSAPIVRSTSAARKSDPAWFRWIPSDWRISVFWPPIVIACHPSGTENSAPYVNRDNSTISEVSIHILDMIGMFNMNGRIIRV